MISLNPSPHFLLNIDKPVGLTSYDVVRHFKRTFPREFKIGHLGTLDPFASGLLLVALNGGNRLMELFHQHLPKTYYGIGQLGVKTATGDMTSSVIEEKDISHLQDFDLLTLQSKIVPSLSGEYWQAPPAYSAAKFQGKALYEWAREGEIVIKPPKKRHIFQLEILYCDGPYLHFRATVSGGTYIRTLFEDMAQRLETIGTLTTLRRETIGPLSVNQSYQKESWPISKEWDWSEMAIPIEKAFPLPFLILQEQNLFRYMAGNLRWSGDLPLDCTYLESQGMKATLSDHFWVYREDLQKTVGLAQRVEDEVSTLFNFPDFTLSKK